MKYFDSLKDKAIRLRNEIFALSLALKDKRTPFYAKILIGLTISYALSPIDLIPDFIPVLGYLDDMIILPLMITLSIKLIPEYVLIECRDRVKDNYNINKRIGLPSAIMIILIWIACFGLLVFRLFLACNKRV